MYTFLKEQAGSTILNIWILTKFTTFFLLRNRNIKEEVIIKGIIEMKQENTKIIVKQDFFIENLNLISIQKRS